MNRWSVLLAGLAVLATASMSQAGWAVGVRIGPGFGCGPPCYRGWYGYGYPYYRPYPVIVAPPPVVYAPAPVVVAQPAPAVSYSPEQAADPAPNGNAPPPPPPAKILPVPAPVARAANNDLSALNDPSPQARADAIIELGRNRDRQAVAPITRALREDGSPLVREAAARALGLIALPGSLAALQNAAQADPDRDVRRSAAFAADVIRANMPR